MDKETKKKLHKEICEKLFDTYVRKNQDYGDSFVKVRNKFPIAILVRLNDKLNRLESLLQSNDRKVEDESIYDTFLDLANYCIMELIEMRIDAEFITEHQNQVAEEIDLTNDLPYPDFETGTASNYIMGNADDDVLS